METSGKVCVILDPDFGEKLSSLPSGVSIWVVDTPENARVAQRLWKERNDSSHIGGITTFGDPNAAPETVLLRSLDTIDLHHGRYSTESRYNEVEVIGISFSDKLRTEFGKYGFVDFSRTAAGFIATRD